MKDPMWMSGDDYALGIEEDDGIDIPDPVEDD